MEEDSGFGLLDYMRSDEEPELGRMAIGFGFVILLIFIVLYDVLYPGHGFPVVSDVVPLLVGVMDSSIWFFILGIMIGFFSLVASVLVGAVEE
tara:strand:+ start:620 stop:898 length:279 start_codon:yes stop_codon:yes gene_type:complete